MAHSSSPVLLLIFFQREEYVTCVVVSTTHNAMEQWKDEIGCILAAEQMQKNWKTAVTDFLQNYQATTGVSPSELLHNRRMRTKLDIFPVKDKNNKCVSHSGKKTGKI